MNHPHNNGTTTGVYQPKPMHTPRPGAYAHLAIPSLTSNGVVYKATKVVAPPPTPEPAMAKTKQIPAKPVKPAVKRAPKDEDYSTSYVAPMPMPAPVEVPQDEPAKPTRATPRARQKLINPDALVICNDPLPTGRGVFTGKYDDVFAKLQPGQSLKCESAAVGRIQGALRKFVQVRKLKGVLVRSTKDYGDGMGRVWLLKDQAGA